MSKKRLILIVMMMIIAGMLSSCARLRKNVPAVNVVQEEQYPASTFYKSQAPAEGSLWTDSGEFLFEDQKARQPGDTIIVDIVENATSKVDANTKAERASSVSAGVPNLLGHFKRRAEGDSYLDAENLIGADYASKIEGKGSSDRSGQITASIGATITDVLPNGNLVIYGRREMKVNNETQYITINGVVRPEDVGSDNRVKSTYLANARISYSGKGVLADKQKAGWLARILDSVWPF